MSTEGEVFKTAFLLPYDVAPETPEIADRTRAVDWKKPSAAADSPTGVGRLAKVLSQADEMGHALTFRRDALGLISQSDWLHTEATQ